MTPKRGSRRGRRWPTKVPGRDPLRGRRLLVPGRNPLPGLRLLVPGLVVLLALSSPTFGGNGGAVQAQEVLPGPPPGLPQPEATRSLVAPEDAPRSPRGGDGLMYIGTYEHGIYVLDEATEEVVDRIPLETGIPRRIFVNSDQSRFYVLDISLENIEVVDLATRRTRDVVTLSRGNERVLIRNAAVAPGDDYLLLVARSYRELPDRFEIGPMRILRYDLDRGEVVGEVPWPDGKERENVRLLFSADGRSLYLFLDEIRVYETEGFTEVDRWAYTEIGGWGFGRFDFGFPESPYAEPGVFVGLFRTTDPVQGRSLMGVARVELDRREVEFFPLGPPESRLSFILAPGGERAFGVNREVGDYNFWSFDLEGGRVEARTPFQGRPRMTLQVSSNGRLLYIYNAGNTIDLWDAEGHRYLRTILMDADTTTDLIVLPRPDPPGPGR